MELSALSIDPSDSVSKAIQRFRESKTIQDQAEYHRKHRLSTICRRDSRRTRRQKAKGVLPLTRKPSTIIEIPSDQEEQGLLSPPDSQSRLNIMETPSTPAPKPKIRKLKRRRVYNEHNGHLGLSSPPYDPSENSEEWYMDDMEVGDVPSSVLRGVEGLWALTC